MRDVRLGDDIDDYCVRCKRVMNHAVVSVMNGGPAKVRCRTCHSDHDFRHEQAPPPKVDARKAALFNEVLKKVAPGDVYRSWTMWNWISVRNWIVMGCWRGCGRRPAKWWMQNQNWNQRRRRPRPPQKA
jgi:hypothetical protein